MIRVTRLPKTAGQGIDITQFMIHGSQIHSDGSEEIDKLANAFRQYLDEALMDDAGEIAPAFIHFANATQFSMYSTFPTTSSARAKRILQCVRHDWMSWMDRPFYYFETLDVNHYRAYYVTMSPVELRNTDYDFEIFCRTIGEPWVTFAGFTPERLANG